MENRLQKIFTQWGFEKLSPTDALLEKLDMTRKRFFQLVENKGNQEMTVSEQLRLQAWLKSIHKIDMRLFDEAGTQLKIQD
ncbi:hypothetical protein D770_20445 [Flammeovirgaceae bacterium 311]|nr:hypothetical protein D770_20445 [Flammeovirgaceae bacterium 311]